MSASERDFDPVPVRASGFSAPQLVVAADDAANPTAASRSSAAPTPVNGRAVDRLHRVSHQPGFVLHSYPYKETSLIIDAFTRDYGRVALIAKGAKRPHSRLRGVLQTFQPLTLAWSGRSEMRTLIGAEWVGGMLPLEHGALLCGFYLNELLIKLLARDDPHPALFEYYIRALNQLAQEESAAIVLRQFERALLKQTGVAGDFTLCTVTGKSVIPTQWYVLDPERGPRPALIADNWPRIAGKTLLDMERDDYADPITLTQSKLLMRFLLAYHLGGVPLNTRQILIDLMQL